MNNSSLFEIAVTDYKCAKKLFECATFETDETYLNNAAYHLEQAVEKGIKFVMENNGVKFKWEHKIESLITDSKNVNLDLHLNNYIVDHAEMFTAWEANTRYIINYKVEANKIKEALPNVELFLNEIKSKEFIADSEKILNNVDGALNPYKNEEKPVAEAFIDTNKDHNQDPDGGNH